MSTPNQEWGSEARLILKSQMARRGLTYRDLSALLAMAGVHETEANLRNKVSRRSFTAAFFLQCLFVMRVTELKLT
jgi:hypothetical protein